MQRSIIEARRADGGNEVSEAGGEKNHRTPGQEPPDQEESNQSKNQTILLRGYRIEGRLANDPSHSRLAICLDNSKKPFHAHFARIEEKHPEQKLNEDQRLLLSTKNLTAFRLSPARDDAVCQSRPIA